MPGSLPNPAEVMRAIEIYLKLAHPKGLPMNVRSQLSALKTWQGDFFTCPSFVPDLQIPPTRYTLRLGNQFYPHMKLAIESCPGNKRYLYRADTHDRHVCPAQNSAEYPVFCDLMQKNQTLAEAIDAAWEADGLPTFKAYLREDLKKRQMARLV